MADAEEPQLYTVFGPQEGFFVPSKGVRALLLLTVTLGAGLVLTGCGDEDTATTPAPAPPPPPPPAPEPEPEPEPEPQAPGTPTGLMVSATTETSITWTWNAVDGALAYLVQQSMDEVFDDTDTVIPPTTETSHTASDLAPGTTVYVRVAAAAGSLEAPLLSAFTTHVTGMSDAPPPPVPPAAPSGLAATASGMDFIEWTWTAVEGATGYYAQFSTDEMFAGADDPMAVEGTSYRRDGLDAGMTAYLRVASTDGTLMSDWSMHATGMTTMPDAPVPPAAPMGLSITATGADYIEWSWEAVDGATGYEVQFSTDEGMLMDSDAMAVDGTSHRQMGLAEGSSGYLRVRAVADDLAGMWTAHLTGMTGMTPAAPATLEATATGDSITWTWGEVEGADGYQIQYSADGVFTGSTETMDAEGNSYTKDGLTAGTSAFLRVRATSGGSGVQELLMSGWTMPTKGTTMVPEPPAVPTGLAAEGGEGSITWTWDEVDGATGYEVQFSTDPGFSDAETMAVEGTSYMMSDLSASTRGYLRVRAVNDAGSSDWAPTVSATTAAAPVVPPAALTASFTIPEGEYPMKPDSEDDEAKAMASVNGKITVMSNAAATITPMFEPDANGQSLVEGDGNMPFAFVTWSAMQSAVVSDAGATFKITRAGTTGENANDVAYVTCGPFECSESSNDGAPSAPVYSIANSAECSAWDPEVELRVGYIDNTVNINPSDDDTDPTTAELAAVANDGVDVGWTYNSSLDVKVSHAFSGASGGKNYTATGLAVGDTSRISPLTMTDAERASGSTDVAVNAFEPALLVDYASDEDDGTIPINCAVDTEYALRRGTLQKPEECFRIVTADVDQNAKTADPDYLGAYTLMLDPQGADLGTAWGSKVKWETDPFEDHTCEAMPFKATDYIEADVCDILFKDEVETALAAGWGGSDGEDITFTDNASPRVDLPSVVDGSSTVTVVGGLNIAAPDLDTRTMQRLRFATLWYNTAHKGKQDKDFYAGVDQDPTTTADNDTPPRLTSALVDEDGDPKYGDFGKVDLAKRNPKDATPADATDAGSWVAGSDGIADNTNDSTAAKCTDGDGGDDCDAEFSTDIVVKFASGTALGCTDERTVTIKCTWNANGDNGRYRADDHFPTALRATGATADDDLDFFVGDGSGGFTTAGGTDARIAGHIGAFAECTVE